jgi:hypothetical protein
VAVGVEAGDGVVGFAEAGDGVADWGFAVVGGGAGWGGVADGATPVWDGVGAGLGDMALDIQDSGTATEAMGWATVDMAWVTADTAWVTADTAWATVDMAWVTDVGRAIPTVIAIRLTRMPEAAIGENKPLPNVP